MPCVLPLQIFSGWVITILFACGICSLFVALGVNSPSRYSIDQINDAQSVRLSPAALLSAPALAVLQVLHLRTVPHTASPSGVACGGAEP